MALLTNQEIRDYLGLSTMSDSDATMLYDQAYSSMLGLTNVEDFEGTTWTDRQDFIGVGPYYLNARPEEDGTGSATIVSINGDAVSYTADVDYLSAGRRLLFSSKVSLKPKNEEFNFIDIEYNSGFGDNVPGDFKSALLLLVKYNYDNSFKSSTGGISGLKTYSQGDISMERFGQGEYGLDDNEMSSLAHVVGKYKFIDVYS